MPESAAAQARLTLKLSGQELSVSLGDGVAVIGSGRDCDLRLSGSGIAGRHLAVQRQEHRFVCAPVEPGLTFTHNGHTVSECTLQHGDTLGLGAFTLTFQEPQAFVQAAGTLPARLVAWAQEPQGQTIVLALAFAIVAVVAAWAARAGAEAAWRSQLASRHLLEAQLAALDLQGTGISANDLTSNRLAEWLNRQRARGVLAGDVDVGVWRPDGQPIFPVRMADNMRRVHDYEAWPREPTIGLRGGGGVYARVVVFGRDLRPQAHIGILWAREPSPLAGTLFVVAVAAGVGVVAALGLARFARRNLATQLRVVADSIAAFGQEDRGEIAVPDATLPEWRRLAEVTAQRCRLVQAGAVARDTAAASGAGDTPAWWDTVCAVAADPVVVFNGAMRVAAFNPAASELPFGAALRDDVHMMDLIQSCPELNAIAAAFDDAAAVTTHPWSASHHSQVHVLQLDGGPDGRWRVLRFASSPVEGTA